MTQYILTMEENQEAQAFIEFVKNLNFIIKIESFQKNSSRNIPLPRKKGDFFESFGLWKNRDITLKEIREKAWPKRK